MRFKIDWASLIVGRKFTVFLQFPSTTPREVYIRRGDLTDGFFRYGFGGLIHGGGYFRNFKVKYFLYSRSPEFCST